VLKVGMSLAVPLPIVSDRRSFVVIIGVDPHMRTHTASALEPGTHRVLATLQIEATLAGYRQLLRWATRFGAVGARRWAVDNAHGLDSHLAQWLTARGERVSRAPQRPGCGSCPAAAGARTMSLTRPRRPAWPPWRGGATPAGVENSSTVFALWDERRANLAAHRTRLVN
jgi:hypothetical protein